MRLAHLARYLQAKPGPSLSRRGTARVKYRGLSKAEQRILDDATRKTRRACATA